jgi:hypothetical protein
MDNVPLDVIGPPVKPVPAETEVTLPDPLPVELITPLVIVIEVPSTITAPAVEVVAVGNLAAAIVPVRLLAAKEPERVVALNVPDNAKVLVPEFHVREVSGLTAVVELA